MSDVDDLVVLEWSGYRYLMPADNAVAIFKLMQSVSVLESSYDNGTWSYYIGRDKADIVVRKLNKAHYTEALINGERP